MLVGALVATLAAPAAVADPSEAFTAEVQPTCVPASASVTFSASFRNDAAEQPLGSINLTVPDGFTITAIVTPPDEGIASFDPTLLRLRGLSLEPGASVSVAFQASTPVAGDYSWHDPAKLGAGRIQAKPSTDFSGSEEFLLDPSGSSLDALVGVCALSLRFGVPPANAEIGANVTGTTVDPAGAPVTVEVLDGDGDVVASSSDAVSLALLPPDGVVGAAITPTVPTVEAVNGIATFDGAQGDGFSISPQGLGYRITASAGAGIEPVSSDPFDIVNDGVICEGAGCTGEASGDGGSVAVTAPDAQAGDVIEVALDVEELTCQGYEPLEGTPIVTFSVTGDSVRVIQLRVPAALATRPARLDRVCYGSDLAFVDRDGVTTNVGVLPPCPVKTPAIPPCQTLTRVHKPTGDHVITFLAPPGSTRGRT
jgi:hypothetical protein